MKRSLLAITLLSLLSTLNLQPSTAFAAPLGTAFTYQGRLTDGAGAANGNYDLRFTIYDAVTNGTLKVAITNAGVTVTNGLFTTLIDFGQGPNDASAVWLEIAARTNGAGAFTQLNPRQPLTPAPFAFYALNSGNAATAGVASNLLGVLPGAQLSGTYSGALSFDNTGNSFSGNGTGLTNVNAATLGGQGAGNFWQTGGNSGTTPGVNYLGTADNQPLEFRVNGYRALRLEPNSVGPNIIGGDNNTIATGSSFIGGGQYNTIQTNSTFSTIGGGIRNTIQTDATDATIGGGFTNTIQTHAYDSVIGGGRANTIRTNAFGSTIGGGQNNTNDSGFATIPGGDQNLASASAFAAGHRAKAVYEADFVWADTTEADFVATGSKQFLIRASGGVGINTNNPGGAALNVNGSIVATNFVGNGAGLINISAAGLSSGNVGAALNLTNTANTFAGNGAGLTNLNATNLTAGTVADARLSANVALLNAGQTFSGSNQFNNAANVFAGAFTGNGMGLTNLNATNLVAGTVPDARLAGNVARTNQVWLLNGNTGTGSANFLGTTDNQPLELRVNGLRVLRLEPNATGPNVIEGSSANSVSSGIAAAAIGGGNSNQVVASYGTVGGGVQNVAGGMNGTGGYAVVGGGEFNNASGDRSVIGGGTHNTNADYVSVIGGGSFNLVNYGSQYATIAGGDGNMVSSPFDAIGGGLVNTIGTNASASSIGGGFLNTIQASSSATIAGGSSNHITSGANWACIGGGWLNTSSSQGVVIGGGIKNSAGGFGAIIAGGATNVVGGDYGTIGGGANNLILWSSSYNTIAGGQYNSIEDLCSYSAISGGVSNTMHEDDLYCAIGGGINNNIGFGLTGATIAGGGGNACAGSSMFPTVGGGQDNNIGGNYATVPGGNQNVAYGDNSFAAGHRAKSYYQGAFVWADSTEADFTATGNNQYLIRANGGVGIGVINPAGSLDVGGRIYLRGSTAGTTAGLWLDDMGVTTHSNRAFVGLYSSGYVGFWGDAGAGWGMMMNVTNGYVGIGTDTPTHRLQVGTAYCDGSAWYPSSDRNVKENFKPVDTLAVLDKVAAMPVSRWNYKQDTATEHIGPMAQDFHAAFNVGPDDKHIADVDEGGVALAAIQGLNQKLNEKDAEIQALEQRLAALEKLVKLPVNASR